jgi:hypothetical protein
MLRGWDVRSSFVPPGALLGPLALRAVIFSGQ